MTTISIPHLAALFAHPDFRRLSHCRWSGPKAGTWGWTARVGGNTSQADALAEVLEHAVSAGAELPPALTPELVEDVATVLSAPGFLVLERIRGEGKADTWVVELALAEGGRPSRCSGLSPWEAVVVAACALLRVDLVEASNPPEALGVDFAIDHGGVDAVRLLLMGAPTLDALCERLRGLDEREDGDELADLIDFDKLPTYSQSQPEQDGEGFLSYDERRVLRYSEDPGFSWYMEPRPDLDEE